LGANVTLGAGDALGAGGANVTSRAGGALEPLESLGANVTWGAGDASSGEIQASNAAIWATYVDQAIAVAIGDFSEGQISRWASVAGAAN
jgi:hypothetical protein